MRFAEPMFLWLIPPVVAGLTIFFVWSARKRQSLITRFIQERLLPNLVVDLSPTRRRIRASLIVAAVICCLLALARPQWGFVWEEARIKGLDIVVAIDTSRSMLAADIAPNRLARAKLAALDLMKLASSDRLGLVAFAGTAFLQCPLTIDEAAFGQAVQAIEAGTIPTGGSALAGAIETALTAFKEGDSHKVLVLFSDGEDQDTETLEAASKAGEAGLKIYTIGLGTTEGELIRIRQADGRMDFVRDEQGNVVKSRLNEDLLRQIASASTGGFYLPLRGAKTIETLYEEALSKLPKSELQEKFVRRYHERFHWPLSFALLLLAAEMLISESARARAKSRGKVLSNQVARATVTLMALALLPPLGADAATSPEEALKEYRAGHYDKAQRDFEELLKKRGDPRLSFNAGAAAYRNGQFEQAIKHFSEAVNSPDLKLQQDGYYNRGNAQYYLGEQADEREVKMDAWKKALQDFQSSLKLDPQDGNAEFNKNWVQQRLKELEQQPPPEEQQQSQDKQEQNQEQEQDHQQQQPNQSQEQQSPGQDHQQSKEQLRQDQQQGPEQRDEERESGKPEEKKTEGTGQEEKQDKKPESQKQRTGGKQGEEKKEQENQAGNAPNRMSAEDAHRLLDSQKSDEKLLPANKGQPGDLRRPLKDW